jgi:hypothetical protein
MAVSNAVKEAESGCTAPSFSQKVHALVIKSKYEPPKVISFPADRIQTSPASLAGNQ